MLERLKATGLGALTVLALIWAACSPASSAVLIRNDRGGQIGQYLQRFAEVRASGQAVVIDGECLSACTLVLGLVPPERICITDKAKLGFHAAWAPDKKGKPITSATGTAVLWEFYPPKIHRWLKKRGGLTPKMVFLEGQQLERMYKACFAVPAALVEQVTHPLRITIAPRFPQGSDSH
jgi:hypothetical protein